jgi:hypothetical protein
MEVVENSFSSLLVIAPAGPRSIFQEKTRLHTLPSLQDRIFGDVPVVRRIFGILEPECRSMLCVALVGALQENSTILVLRLRPVLYSTRTRLELSSSWRITRVHYFSSSYTVRTDHFVVDNVLDLNSAECSYPVSHVLEYDSTPICNPGWGTVISLITYYESETSLKVSDPL